MNHAPHDIKTRYVS